MCSGTRAEPSSTITQPKKSRLYNLFRLKYTTISEFDARENRIHKIFIAIILFKKEIQWLSAVCSMQIIVLFNFLASSRLSFV